jgi:hypothetical protein
MDVTALRESLFDAERRVVEGSERITRQEANIAERDRDGRNTTEAKELLAALRQTQALHVEARDRALADLSKARHRG